jgi:hypothetical protein
MEEAKETDAASAAQESKAVAVPDTFKVGDNKYQFVYPLIDIPGIGIRTSLECVTDEEAHEALGGLTIVEHLVKIGSGAVAEV